MKDNSKSLLALIAGVAAGTVLGILFAPEKGVETRDKLNDALKNLGDSIKDRAAEEIENFNSLKEKVVDNLKTQIADAQEKFNSEFEKTEDKDNA